MTHPTPTSATAPSRRDFLKTSSAAVAAGSVGTLLQSAVYAGEDNTLRVGLVGCGGRGTGAAAQALTADANTKLVAMGDAFGDRLGSALKTLKNQPVGERVDVPEERQFVGFDAYQKVIDSCDVVLLATPPHFRPAQLEAAVQAGKHCFVEKPIAVDAPGVRQVMKTCDTAAEKGLSIVSGLCWRYHKGMQATFEEIHSGRIGDVVSAQVSYLARGLWYQERKPDWSDMEWQVRNWLYFTWLSGDHIVEQHIHSLDKLAWAMGDEYPVHATGVGGRETRTDDKYGNVYDHFAITYEFDGGRRGFGRCRQQDGCVADVTDHVFCTKGRMDVMRHAAFDYDGKGLWRFREKGGNMYQLEHDALFAAIRKNEPINNGDYMTKSTLLAILGREAAYTGQKVTWEQMLNSEQKLGPDTYDWGDLPVPPVAEPGVTKLA